MPQPRSVTDLTTDLLALYTATWQRIDAEQDRLLHSWPSLSRTRRLTQLRDLRQLVDQLMDTADEQALRFANDQIPQAYLLGAAAAGVGIPEQWAKADLDAIGVLVNDTYQGLLDATTFVRDSTKQLIRVLSRQHVADKLIRGDTAVQAGNDLADALADARIGAVVYRNGAVHGLADYADMLVRTKTAEAYSVATLNQLHAVGVGYVEVFDGIGCGWTSHNDVDKANGTVRTVEQARAYPVSHPRCRRAFGGRPDVTNAREAAAARPTTTPAQQADQAQAEAARELDVSQRASRRSFERALQRRADGLLSDASNRVRSPAHARVLARRQLLLERRRRARAG